MGKAGRFTYFERRVSNASRFTLLILNKKLSPYLDFSKFEEEGC
jgi:hypothetical protein